MGNQKLSKSDRQKRRNAEKDDLLGKTPERASGSRKGMDDEWQTLNAQTGALESFINGANRKAEMQRRRKLENILPPPDRGDFPRDQAGQRMSRGGNPPADAQLGRRAWPHILDALGAAR